MLKVKSPWRNLLMTVCLSLFTNTFSSFLSVWEHGQRRLEDAGGGQEVSVWGAVSGLWGVDEYCCVQYVVYMIFDPALFLIPLQFLCVYQLHPLSPVVNSMFNPNISISIYPPYTPLFLSLYRTATTRQSSASMTEVWRLQQWWRAWRGRWSFCVWPGWKTSYKQTSGPRWSCSGTLASRLAWQWNISTRLKLLKRIK